MIYRDKKQHPIAGLKHIAQPLFSPANESPKKVFVDIRFLPAAGEELDSVDLVARCLTQEMHRNVTSEEYQELVTYIKPFLDPALSAYIIEYEILDLFMVTPIELRICHKRGFVDAVRFHSRLLYSWNDCRSCFARRDSNK